MKVLVLCGGKGKTLWPISRDSIPKQFSKTIFSKSLFQQTIELWKNIVPPSDIFAVAPEEFKFFIRSQSIEVFEISPVLHITEKKPLGTLKSVSQSILKLIQDELSESETVVICNSDQIWKTTPQEFADTIRKIVDNIIPDKIICVGSPNSKHLRDRIEVQTTKDSIFQKLVGFSKTSDIYNVGMYISTLKAFRDGIQKTFSKSLESIIEEEEFNGMPFEEVISRKPENSVVFVWNTEVIDIDDISDISSFVQKDKNGNFLSGDVVVSNSRNTMVISTKRLVAVEGIKDINVIETPDVVYVSGKNSDKSLLDLIKDRNEVKGGITEYRPWGSYTVIDRGPNYQIKRIIVNPGESLSLQLHYHRSEHWVVVRGTAKVTLDDRIIFLKENESTFIPKTAKHRLENPGKIPLEIIEIQIGEYISEDDIVRFSDVYGRSE